jgi:methionyl-tRNA formyltransferase
LPDIVIFVCEVPAFIQFAEQELRKHSPEINFFSIKDKKSLSELPSAVLSRARLIGFTTEVIIPQSILAETGFGCYNFHPGPPEYPGWEPIRFALYDDARSFGVTAHIMTSQIDSGFIVAVKRFPIGPNASYTDFQAEMVKVLLELFRELARELATSNAGLRTLDIAWANRRYARKDALDLCDITPLIEERELNRRIRAFGSGEYPLRPTFRVHNIPFVFIPDELLRTMNEDGKSHPNRD